MGDEKPSVSFLSRYRSPTFSRIEVQTLLNLIDKHKYTLLNKSTNSAVNQAKDFTWEKVTKTFNSRGFKHERSLDALKTKWDNLKRDARKHAKNMVDGDDIAGNDWTKQIVTMMFDVEHNAPMETSQDIDDDEELNGAGSNDEKGNQNLKRKICWENSDEKNSDESNDEHVHDTGRGNRSFNFTPQECSLLLECVRNEKSHVFAKGYNAHTIGLKNKAWRRIADAFNKKSPQKRTQKVLRTKFNNMKTVAKSMSIKDAVKGFPLNTKHEKLINENSKPIKSEPMFELEMNGPDDEDDRLNSDSNHFAPDPLSNVLNSDSGIGSTHSSSSSQDKEVAKLQLELLNYKMETARLERQRLEEISRAEAANCEANSIATALRVRAARLEAAAAAAKLPADHPALVFTPEEQPAERYLRQYEHT